MRHSRAADRILQSLRNASVIVGNLLAKGAEVFRWRSSPWPPPLAIRNRVEQLLRKDVGLARAFLSTPGGGESAFPYLYARGGRPFADASSDCCWSTGVDPNTPQDAALPQGMALCTRPVAAITWTLRSCC